MTDSNCLSYKGYSDNVVTITGTPTVHGAIFVDGEGRLGIGNSGNDGNCANCLPNLMYDPQRRARPHRVRHCGDHPEHLARDPPAG